MNLTNIQMSQDLKSARYVVAVALTFGVIAAIISLQLINWQEKGAQQGADHFAALPLKGDHSWYLNFGGHYVPEIQDLDLYYHNIGNSIAQARKADIILLGPSFVAYALDPTLLREFGQRHGLKIYNLAFIGVRSGEFSRMLIERWGLHPKLWMINVDDQFEHFFDSSLTLTIGPTATPITAANYGRLRGLLNVARRNVRWRLESYWEHLSRGTPLEMSGLYRRPEDGAAYLDYNPRYRASDNAVLQIKRDQDCHATDTTTKNGRKFLGDIGGKAVLILVPHSQYCRPQARELERSLDVEALLTPKDLQLTTVDGGGHLDHNGAVAYTTSLLSLLEKSKTFLSLFPAPPVPE
jgi:hypothetical protein